jgi:ADP-heptose:LPS heptosyltransferase
MPLEHLRPLTALPGVALYNLHVERSAAAELNASGSALPLHPWSDSFTTFSDSAAAVAALDLVVSVDTAQAHLAAAVDTPCLLMLPHSCDWRWTDIGEQCGWYPRCQMFRQPRPGDWEAVVASVSRHIERQIATIAHPANVRPSAVAGLW